MTFEQLTVRVNRLDVTCTLLTEALERHGISLTPDDDAVVEAPIEGLLAYCRGHYLTFRGIDIVPSGDHWTWSFGSGVPHFSPSLAGVMLAINDNLNTRSADNA